jgi:hypothetical protein
MNKDKIDASLLMMEMRALKHNKFETEIRRIAV